jgi:LmbE family N-acetylglucosaminyl deacetylase
MDYDPDAPTVVASPHLDDAALSAWTVITTPPVLIVNVCTASPPPGTCTPLDRMLGVADSAALMQLRRDEDAAVLAAAGCAAAALGFLDQQYRLDPLAAGAVADALDQVAPRARRIYAPAGIGGHPDHVATREAAVACARSGGVPVALYAEQPYATQYGWPHWVTGAEPEPHLVPDARWPDAFANSLVRWDALRPRVVTLDPDEMARKLRGLECYRTQFPALNAGPLDRLRQPAIAGYELHWDVA